MFDLAGNSPLVSIIIPCYNQAHFLDEAIESVLAQTYRPCEILVIDDGSTDNTFEVARIYSAVRYFRQENQGLSSARNTGIRHSHGNYLLFLDADDLLLPEAVGDLIKTMRDHPECAFVFGRHRMVNHQGMPIQVKPHDQKPDTEIGSYAWLLQGNHIGMHATVLYRRSVFDDVGGFNNQLPACEDYDLYLRITRQFPIAYHDHLVAEYRKHDQNMSRDIPFMLSSVLAVLGLQLPYIRGNLLYEKMYRRGIRNWIYFYSREFIIEVSGYIKAKKWKRAIQVAAQVFQYALQSIGRSIKSAFFLVRGWMRSRRKQFIRLPVRRVDFGELRRVTPLNFGKDQARPGTIHRYYIESFLNRHAEEIQGNVLEVGCGSFGSSRDPRRKVISEEQFILDRDGFSSGAFDCIILPHTIYTVYELRQALGVFYRMIMPGGVLLATLPGMPAQDLSWDGYWFYTQKSAERLFSEVFPSRNLEVRTHGNVLAAASLLHCIPAEELEADELASSDPHYPIVISIRAVKPANPLPEDVE